MIDWNKYFDNVYILSGCSNFEKREQLKNEFNRIGLKKYHWWYGYKNNLIELQAQDKVESHTITTYSHYGLIKTCYDLGYDHVLIMEDDVRFLNNINEIETQLNIFLDNKDKCDFYLFDYWIYQNAIFKFDCIYLNRKAMEYMIYCLEHFDLVIDNYLITLYLYPNNYIKMSYTFGNDYFGYKDIYIPKEINILPIQVMLSPIRICLEEFSPARPENFEEIKNNYNLII